MHALVDVLKKQLDDARDRERDARERERALMDERDRLLTLLETEQQTRRELETKLLPAPKPAPTGKVRVWALVGLLAVVAAFAGWHWRDRIVAVLAP